LRLSGRNIITAGLSIICSALFVVSDNVNAQNIDNVIDVSYAQQKKSAILKYSKANDKDRFIFEFAKDQKIPYEIKSDDSSTTITFYSIFDIETKNIKAFNQYQNITQKKLSNRSIEITFPVPLASSFEHLNSIILDLSANAEKQKSPEEVKPLLISSLSFSWNMPVAATVFKRGKYLWIVFNQYQQLNTDELIKNAGEMVRDIIQLPHSKATILRIEAVDEIFSEVRKEGLLWIVDLYNRITDRNVKPIEVVVDTSIPDKPFIQTNLPHTEEIFSFLDPEVGDMLMAITSSEAGYAFLSGYKYPDFQFLPTSQGMAVNSDDFGIGIIRNLNGFVLQTTQHPLNVSKNLEQLKQDAEIANSGGVNISKELAFPIVGTTFAKSETYMRTQIKKAKSEDREKQYTELVRFYLSYGLGSNALNVLDIIKKDIIEKEQKLSVRMLVLTGISEFLMKRYDEAFKKFNIPELKNNSEVSLWKSLSDTSTKDNSAEILRNIGLVHVYPDEIKKRVSIRGVEYALEKENYELAQKFINLLRELTADNELNAMLHYFEAEKIRLQGYIRSALPEYKIAAMSFSNKYSALARYKIADFNSQIANARLNRTIQEFERLKFSWGEKNFKIKVLNKLVDLYLKNSDFYMALKTLKDISLLSSKYKRDIERRMIEIMEEIYYYNNDNQFSPIKALAMFDDFGDLVNKSTKQTAIKIKLADRLVAIDLLDRAYVMLNEHLGINKSILSNNEISAIGSRLALINLFKNQESEALRNLYETEHDDISEVLKLQRKIIEAHALTKQGKTDEALNLLEDDMSKNAILLKSQIYWEAKDWDNASDTIRLLIKKPEKNKPLSDEQIHYVLDWLTTLKQAGKETVIVRIKNTFSPYFKDTKYYSLFRLLTGTQEKDRIDMSDISQTINDIQLLSDFTKQYTEALINNDLIEKDAQEKTAN